MSEESLAIANKALALQIEANKKYAAELLIVNKQLVFQNEEREKRAAELVLANKELAFQNTEKENRAAELIIANNKLIFENTEKEKRAAELVLANKELAFQNTEKENRAAELIVANNKLIFENIEKENRATELIIANKELAFQNIEKEKRAAELAVANKELAFQNIEKEKRAAELIVANKELAFQNTEKEKRAAELLIVNKELKSFIFISSHDLQEPLRKIRIFSSRILDNEYLNLSESGMNYFNRLQKSSLYMQMLINDLLAFSRTTISERIFENKDLNKMVKEVAFDFKDEIDIKSAEIKCINLSSAYIIPFQFKQLIHNLIGNALKFYNPNTKPIITISSTTFISNNEIQEDLIPGTEYLQLSIHDNGIGFEPVYRTKIFEIFQRLNDKNLYKGTGIGLTIAKKIVENHDGMITATSGLGQGATFDVYIPIREKTISNP
jgi:signal transduction histidine kinase